MTARALRHAAIAWLVRGLVALARALPPAAAVRAGSLAGLAAWALSPRLRALGHDNLRQVFPTWTARERSRTLRRSGQWLGMAGAEALVIASGRRTALGCVTVSEGVRSALQESTHGTVVATGHLGNWELLGAVLAALGHDTAAVVRRTRNDGVARVVTGLRAELGFHEIPRGPHVALHALRTLRRGGLVGLLCDQASDQSNAWIPFMDRPAATPLGPALLARRSGARLVVAWLRREGPFRYTLDGTVVMLEESDVATMTRVNAVLAAAIRERPSEWVWFHDRWAAPQTDAMHVRQRPSWSSRTQGAPSTGTD